MDNVKRAFAVTLLLAVSAFFLIVPGDLVWQGPGRLYVFSYPNKVIFAIGFIFIAISFFSERFNKSILFAANVILFFGVVYWAFS